MAKFSNQYDELFEKLYNIEVDSAPIVVVGGRGEKKRKWKSPEPQEIDPAILLRAYSQATLIDDAASGDEIGHTVVERDGAAEDQNIIQLKKMFLGALESSESSSDESNELDFYLENYHSDGDSDDDGDGDNDDGGDDEVDDISLSDIVGGNAVQRSAESPQNETDIRPSLKFTLAALVNNADISGEEDEAKSASGRTLASLLA